MPTYNSPGVYLESVFLKPQARLPTGVPGFVGFAGGAANTPISLHRKDEFAAMFDAVAGSFLADALSALGPLTDLDLVAIPDAMSLSNTATRELVQRRVLEHCAEHDNRLAILDAHPAETTAKVLAHRIFERARH